MKTSKKVLMVSFVMLLFMSFASIANIFTVSAYTQGHDGMGPVVISGGKRDFIWPVPGHYNIQSCFYDHRNHCAIDISAPVNTSVVASYSGKVIQAVDGGTSYYGDGFGNYVVLQHSYSLPGKTITLYTRYSHLNSVSVKKGDNVTARTVIGKVGTTGSSTGYHLDFQILYGNWQPYQTYSIDPYSNQLLELPANIVVYDSWDCGKSYYNLIKNLYSKSLDTQQPTTILYPTSGSVVKFASGVGNNMYLDFACSSDNVQIYENCDNHSNPAFVKSQYFKLTHVGNGWYTVTNTGNGKAMDVDNWTPDPQTNIHQYSLHNGDNQLFRFYNAGNGYCYIKSKLGCYVDVKWGDKVNNTNVWTYTFNGSDSQKWKMQSHSHSYTSKTTSATCTKEGKKINSCRCGVTTTTTIAKKGHSYGSAVVTKKPTYTTTGTKTYTCTVCKAKKTETIAKLTLGQVKNLKATPISTASIKFSWSKVNDAEKYEFYYSTDGKKWSKITTSKTSITVNKLKSGTSYKVKVRAVKGKVYGSYSSTLTTATKPATVTLSKVTAGSKSATPAWKTVNGASGYQIMYSTSSKFSSSKTATVSKGSSTKTTIKNLTKGKKYYFKVRAYKTVGNSKNYGAWSSVKNVKVK